MHVGSAITPENTCWKELFVVYNASEDAVKIPLPQGRWTVLADAQQADCQKAVEADREGQLYIPACSGMVLGSLG